MSRNFWENVPCFTKYMFVQKMRIGKWMFYICYFKLNHNICSVAWIVGFFGGIFREAFLGVGVGLIFRGNFAFSKWVGLDNN